MRRTLTATTILLCLAEPALAYIGPGVGAGMIATVLGVLAAIVFSVIAIFWYPLKRLLKRRSRTAETKANKRKD
jgi:biopolymer transport protein ExbB/TolQ